MSWWNPFSWGGGEAKDAELTLDALVRRVSLLQNTTAGVRVTPDTALEAPTVFSIVNVMSRAVASLSFRVEQDQTVENKRRVVELPQHEANRLLARKPNQWQTSYEYWSLVMLRLLLYGEFFAVKQKTRDGRTIRLHPVSPEAVEVEQMNSGSLRYSINENGIQRTLPSSLVHRITFQSTDGIRGFSPVQKNQNTIALEIAAEQFGATVFGSGAIPNGIITRSGHFKDAASAKQFSEDWNRAFRSKRGTAVLEEGFKFEPIQMNAEESQFLETRKHQRTVIAGLWGVPPHKVGDLERATFSNIEELSLDWVINALRPYLECIESAVDRDFLTEREIDDKVRSRFQTSDILRGDIKTRSESLRIQREMGIISANEWRAIEGMDAREDEEGDDYITPLNFGSSGDTDDDGDDEPQGDTQVVAMRRIK